MVTSVQIGQIPISKLSPIGQDLNQAVLARQGDIEEMPDKVSMLMLLGVGSTEAMLAED